MTHPTTATAGGMPEIGTIVSIEHDGFVGTVIGYYTTREGKPGVVLQQIGTKVVHVYGARWIRIVESEPTRPDLTPADRR